MTKFIKFLKNPFRIIPFLFRNLEVLIGALPFFHFIKGTKNIDPKVTLRIWFIQKVLGFNKYAYWPMHHSSIVTYPKNVLIGVDTNPGYNPGCFVHGVNKIYIGDYTKIAPNVGIMSGNHDIYNLQKQTTGTPIIIGKYCWLGMNSIILPKVELGDHTIVAAGAVVSKSFKDGYCVLAGIPAKVIKQLKKEDCLDYKIEVNHIGYIKKSKFEIFRRNSLNI